MTFHVCDYRNINLETKGIVIYVDPPYKNTKSYKNSKYFDYEEFWNIMRKWSENNVVIISEEQAPDDFVSIWQSEVSRSLQVKNKTKAIEHLFIYDKKYVKPPF